MKSRAFLLQRPREVDRQDELRHLYTIFPMEKFSDVSSDESEEYVVNDDVVKLFDSDIEVDASFSGFENTSVDKSTEKVEKVKSPVKSRRGQINSGPGKVPGKKSERKSAG